jgi:hypothetical protein
MIQAGFFFAKPNFHHAGFMRFLKHFCLERRMKRACLKLKFNAKNTYRTA